MPAVFLCHDGRLGGSLLGIMDTLQIPTNRLDLFIRSVEISSYLPGRIRLRSKSLIGNPVLEGEVRSQLSAFRELSSVEINTLTGSILILYEPEQLRKNAELRKVEEYIMQHARRK